MLDLGERRELFVDHALIDRLRAVRLVLQRPHDAGAVEGAPWGGYATVLQDGALYRRYQRENRPGYEGPYYDGNPGELTRYYESRDGIRWEAPALGLVEVGGSAANNVILAGQSKCSHNFTPFIDGNPAARPDQRFKALAGVHPAAGPEEARFGAGAPEVQERARAAQALADYSPGQGLFSWVSADGLRWRRLSDKPVMTSRPLAFDSQNVAFWCATERRYVCYFRSWQSWQSRHGALRTVSRATSRDFLRWSQPLAMEPNLPGEHLYTSGTHPYFRAPHLHLALPTRFMPARGGATDVLFMAIRPGQKQFTRLFTEAFIPPGPEPRRWLNRANYAAYHVVPTSERELSIYVNHQRYTLRTDGFVAVSAGASQGQLVTKPFRFAGDELTFNAATSAAGSVRVELQDRAGQPLKGYSLRDAVPTIGDGLEHVARWKHGCGVAPLQDRPLRLRFVMREADLYSFRFRRTS